MKILISKNNDPYYNLSLEELILKNENIKDDILFLYINENAIIFGRNQNVFEEVNWEYVKANNIKLVRRVSGGGAVYHDQGNVNFSFITKKEDRSYIKFLEPITNFLQELGLNAQFEGKNDLKVDGMKISGNAQYLWKERMFHHGTLLFDANLPVLGKALKPSQLKMASKGVKSARQAVSNIKPLLKEEMSVMQFVEALKTFFKKDNEIVESLPIDQEELKSLIAIRKSEGWLFGKNPDFALENEKRFFGGTIKINLNVKKNIIKDILFTGDFLSKNDFEKINRYFINQEFSNIKNIINQIKDFENYFGKITKEEVLELFLGLKDE